MFEEYDNWTFWQDSFRLKPRHFSSSRLVMMQNSSRYTSVFLYRKITRINRENSAGNLTFPVHKHLPLQRKITQIIRETFGDNLMIQNSCWYTSLFLYRNNSQIIRENLVAEILPDTPVHVFLYRGILP